LISTALTLLDAQVPAIRNNPLIVGNNISRIHQRHDGGFQFHQRRVLSIPHAGIRRKLVVQVPAFRPSDYRNRLIRLSNVTISILESAATVAIAASCVVGALATVFDEPTPLNASRFFISKPFVDH
jgi:hypothetical protein